MRSIYLIPNDRQNTEKLQQWFGKDISDCSFCYLALDAISRTLKWIASCGTETPRIFDPYQLANLNATIHPQDIIMKQPIYEKIKSIFTKVKLVSSRYRKIESREDMLDIAFIPYIYPAKISLQKLLTRDITSDLNCKTVLQLKKKGIFIEMLYKMVTGGRLNQLVPEIQAYSLSRKCAVLASTRLYKSRVLYPNAISVFDALTYLLCMMYSNAISKQTIKMSKGLRKYGTYALLNTLVIT